MQLNYRLHRSGFTLIEMMIALVITMMMVFAMVEAFQWIGEATTTGRAQIEMAGQLRAARYRLELDLNGVTVPMRPWVDNQTHPGYFELIEGPASDSNPANFVVVSPAAASGYTSLDFNDAANVIATGNDSDPMAAASKSMFGDLDDILMFTARNDQEPFRGRYQGTMIESNLAEIIWWAELNDAKPDANPAIVHWDPGETFTIRRRVLLIRPDLLGDDPIGLHDPNAPPTPPTYLSNISTFLENNDVSVHTGYDSTGNVRVVPNSLADLSLRHNRTAHAVLDYSLQDASSKPLGLSTGNLLSPLMIANLPGYTASPTHFGEDVMLTNVMAFDFRVWDPNVPLMADAGGLNEALVPGDPGYNVQFQAAVATPAILVGQGAYIDLGGMAHELTPPANPTNNTVLTSASFKTLFMGAMANKAQLGNANFVYDPWTIAYEKDGFNQDGDPEVDEGTDGLDTTDTITGTVLSGPDDARERETSPPYPYPLKSLRVSIRMYEPDTRQVRQTTHEMSFSQ